MFIYVTEGCPLTLRHVIGKVAATSGGPLAFAPGGRVVEWKANQKELQSWIEVVGGEEAASRVMLDLSHQDNEVSTSRKNSWLAAACVVLGALGCHYYM